MFNKRCSLISSFILLLGILSIIETVIEKQEDDDDDIDDDYYDEEEEEEGGWAEKGYRVN